MHLFSLSNIIIFQGLFSHGKAQEASVNLFCSLHLYIYILHHNQRDQIPNINHY